MNSLIVIVIIGIIFVSLFFLVGQQEVKEDTFKKTNKILPSIDETATYPPITENVTIEELSEIIEAVNTTKISNEIIKNNIIDDFKEKKYAPITIKVNESKYIDELLVLLGSEFALEEISQIPRDLFAGNITVEGLNKIKEHSAIERITYHSKAVPELDESLSLIKADEVWNLKIGGINITGENGNTTICIIDTGVNYSQEHLGGCPPTSDINTAGCSKVVGGYNFIDGNANPMDTDGHGTHVAGITIMNSSLKGVAYGAKIIAIKADTDIKIRDGINWCIENRTKFNISVISISLSIPSSGFHSSSCDDVDEAVKAANNATNFGFVVTASSGNQANISGIRSPACGSNVTSVGATYDKNNMNVTWLDPNQDCTDNLTKVDQIACGGNRASNLDLLAPGSEITSANLISGFFIRSGTSMSAPHVAGVAALMKQANNSLTQAEIENLLKKTGKPVYDNYTDITFRRVDALKSVLASYNPLVITDLQVLNESGLNITSEFKIFNAVNTTLTDVYWTFLDGNGTTYTNKNNKNITLNAYEETFVYLEHNYSTVGNFTTTAYANSSQLKSNSQQIDISVEGTNLKLTNFTIINSSGTERTFEFYIENYVTSSLNNVYWNMTVTGEGGVNSTNPITLSSGERTFIYVNYNYATGGLHNVTVKIDPSNIIGEDKENDNEATITNN